MVDPKMIASEVVEKLDLLNDLFASAESTPLTPSI
jgi:hypothetical protein